MKKILFLLIIITFLFKCDVYEMNTYPQLSGQWILTDVMLSNGGSTIDGAYHILNDTVLLQQYEPIDFDGHLITFSQEYNDPNVKWYDKFIVNKTIWEFETNIVGIPTTINGQRNYEESSYYSIGKDLISRQWIYITISEGNRHYQLEEYGLERIKLISPRTWTMFRRNTNIEFFFQETIVLTFRRL